MYLAPPVAAVVLLLAAVGALALVTSVGVFVFTAGLPDAPELPASEVVAAHTGNVRPFTPTSSGYRVPDYVGEKPATTQWDAS